MLPPKRNDFLQKELLIEGKQLIEWKHAFLLHAGSSAAVNWIMRAATLLLLLAECVQAGIVHGIILELSSSRPLARTRVQLLTLNSNGTLQQFSQAMTNSAGQYWFPSLPNGKYMLRATRLGFVETNFGQKRPKGPGTMIHVEGDSQMFAELRMPRFGGITGRVVDENYVGLPGVLVVAYPARLPLQIVGSAKTDERGIYRVALLPGGKYWIRNGAADLEDGSSVTPTFLPGTVDVREAKVVAVEYDADTSEQDLRPFPGKLFKLSGRVSGCPPGELSIKVTLASDTGRKETTTSCMDGGFGFDQLSQGSYELLAESATIPTTAAWIEFRLFQDSTKYMALESKRPLQLSEQVDNAAADAKRILLRRRDLAGETNTFTSFEAMLPGVWDVYLPPTAPVAMKSFRISPPSRDRSSTTVLAHSFEIPNNPYLNVTVQLSKNGGTVSGIVRDGKDPVPAAPVFLVPMDDKVRRLTNGTRQILSDLGGQFAFRNLPAGEYRIVSSSDVDEVTNEMLEKLQAPVVKVSEGGTANVNLEVQTVR